LEYSQNYEAHQNTNYSPYAAPGFAFFPFTDCGQSFLRPCLFFFGAKTEDGNKWLLSDDLAIKFGAMHEIRDNWFCEYDLGFVFPSICMVDGESVGLSKRYSDFLLEGGAGYRFPLTNKVSLALGAGVSFATGTRPLSDTQMAHQYSVNFQGSFSSMFKINPLFAIDVNLRLASPLWNYFEGDSIDRMSAFNGFCLTGTLAVVSFLQ
jgi:hypothetical protein